MANELSSEGVRKCVGYLLDKKEDVHARIAAAESLMHCQAPESRDALFRVVMDETDMACVREEAAGSLGTLWAESSIEYDRLIQIPPRFLDEVVSDFDLLDVRLDKDRLAGALGTLRERYGGRPFMSCERMRRR